MLISIDCHFDCLLIEFSEVGEVDLEKINSPKSGKLENSLSRESWPRLRENSLSRESWLSGFSLYSNIIRNLAIRPAQRYSLCKFFRCLQGLKSWPSVSLDREITPKCHKIEIAQDPHLVIACPGRLPDFARHGKINLSNVSFMVLRLVLRLS